jgi:hypothetical protein
VLVVVVLWGLVGAGCADKVTDSGRSPNYRPRTSPENVTDNLAEAYEARDVEAYARLLAPEFRFYFQSRDVPPDLGRDYWIRDEDLSHTGSLFSAGEVKEIGVDLSYGPATDPTELDKASGTKKIHVTAHVRVWDRYGLAFTTDGDFQDLFFRKGLPANADEDTTLWYLFEWRDIRNPGGNGSAPGGGVDPAGAQGPTPVERITWGMIKQLFP